GLGSADPDPPLLDRAHAIPAGIEVRAEPPEERLQQPRALDARSVEAESRSKLRSPDDESLEAERGAERALDRAVLDHPDVLDVSDAATALVEHLRADEITQPHGPLPGSCRPRVP